MKNYKYSIPGIVYFLFGIILFRLFEIRVMPKEVREFIKLLYAPIIVFFGLDKKQIIMGYFIVISILLILWCSFVSYYYFKFFHDNNVPWFLSAFFLIIIIVSLGYILNLFTNILVPTMSP